MTPHFLPVPDGLSLLEAASLPETFFTVWSNVFMGVGKHKQNDLFLVHGGSGGIGATAIQLGKAFGAVVFTTDGPVDRCSFAKNLGADRVIDYNEEDFVKIVREAGGANIILDTIGGPYIERNIKAASHEGKIIQLAFNLGSKMEINLMPIMLKRLVYTGSTLRSRPEAFKTEIARQLLEKVWPKISEGEIKTIVKQIFPLGKAAEAHTLMESATHLGKNYAGNRLTRKTVQINKTLSLRCPMPVLKLQKVIRGLKSGTRIVLMATDPMSYVDIRHL